MGRQVWGTFSVNDHCQSRAFIADVMLYDCLVIPVPPAGDSKEWDRWEVNKWDPRRQERLIKVLGDRARAVEWDAYHQDQWRSRFEAGGDVAKQTAPWAFQASRTQLLSELQPGVTGVEAITAYPSLEKLERDLGVKPAGGGPIQLPIGAVTAVLGREFLVPDDPDWNDEDLSKAEDLLKAAVELSSDPTFKRKRSSYWRWQREFTGSDVITDQQAVEAAVEEMRELIEEEQAVVRKANIRTTSRYAFLVASITVGLLAGPLSPLALGGAFVSVGQLVTERYFEGHEKKEPAAGALFHDTRRHFGWD